MAKPDVLSKGQYYTKENFIKEANSYIEKMYAELNLEKSSYDAIRMEFINHYIGMALEDYEVKRSCDCTPITTGLNYFFVQNLNDISSEELIKKLNECELVVAVATDKIGEKNNFELLSKLKQSISSEVTSGDLKIKESYSFSDCETNQYTLSIQKVLSKNSTN